MTMHSNILHFYRLDGPFISRYGGNLRGQMLNTVKKHEGKWGLGFREKAFGLGLHEEENRH